MEHGNSENTFRTIRHATSEESDHLQMQRWSDFAICGETGMKTSILGEITNLWLNTSPFQFRFKLRSAASFWVWVTNTQKMQQSQSNISLALPEETTCLSRNIAVTSHEIVEGNRFGRKTNLLYRAFSRQKYTQNCRVLTI